MTALLLRAALSYLLPLLAGYTLISTLWPRSPKLLRIALGTGIGLGVAGALWMAGLMVAKTPASGLVMSESALLLVTAFLLWRKERHAIPDTPMARSKGAGRMQIAAFLLCVILGIASVAMLTSVSPHGGYDAAANWNMKARFLFFDDRPVELLGDLFMPDYPLLLPSLVARGWQYSGQNTIAIPISLAVFFLAVTVLMLMSVLRMTTSGSAAILAGCMAFGTPYLVLEGVSQYADMAICFFITSAIVMLALAMFSEQGTPWLPLLSGLAAGVAACIKNEGILFVGALAAAQGLLLTMGGRWKANGIRLALFLAGLSPGILSLAAFKMNAPVPPNQLVSNMTFATISATIGDTTRHFTILKGFGKNLLFFGDWWINPLLPMLLYTVMRRRFMARKEPSELWLFPTLLFGIMACGYYGVYLFSPYDLQWHIESSLPRLLLQVWPSALLFWTLISAEGVES